MISPGIDEAFLMNLIIAAGAIIHCSVGFGLALIAVPLLLMVKPEAVPGPVIVSVFVLSIIISRNNLRFIDFFRTQVCSNRKISRRICRCFCYINPVGQISIYHFRITGAHGCGWQPHKKEVRTNSRRPVVYRYRFRLHEQHYFNGRPAHGVGLSASISR